MERVINVAQKNKLKENIEERIGNIKREGLTYMLRSVQKKNRESLRKNILRDNS